MLLTVGGFGLAALKRMITLHGSNLLDPSTSPLLPFLGTATFIVVSGYYWRKQQRRQIAVVDSGAVRGNRRARRRKTLLLTPITLDEVRVVNWLIDWFVWCLLVWSIDPLFVRSFNWLIDWLLFSRRFLRMSGNETLWCLDWRVRGKRHFSTNFSTFPRHTFPRIPSRRWAWRWPVWTCTDWRRLIMKVCNRLKYH